jgi:pimeloyl-ACP methyl ester carboxylesterase
MPLDLNPQTIEIKGAVFNYYRTPETPGARKSVLVLQHGFSDNGLCWLPVAEELAAEYDILMPDARGHGRSARVARGQQIDQAADLAELLQALGIEKATLAGHSMGAMIVSEFGARFPAMATALILEDGGLFSFAPGRASMEESPLGKWMLSLQEKSLEQILADCRQEHPAWPEAYARPWCQGKKELDLNFLAAQNRHARWQDTIAAIQCPLLLITADPGQGGAISAQSAREAKELNPLVREINFPGVGHHVRFAVHTAYMQTLRAFLLEIR